MTEYPHDLADVEVIETPMDLDEPDTSSEEADPIDPDDTHVEGVDTGAPPAGGE